MYQVSAEFLRALHAPARFERVRGKVGSVSFNDDNIISLSYSNRCSNTSDVTLGSAYIGQIEATLTNIPINRGEWRDKVITLEWGLVLEDDTVEYVPVGVFTINEATWSGIGVTIKASDNISKLDRSCSPSVTDGKIFDLISLAAKECGLVLAQSESEFGSLPNGGETFGLYPDNDIKTWRDFVSWVVQLCGGFAYADRLGRLAVKTWGSLTTVDSLTETEREYQTTFSDYSTKYDGISVVDIAEQETIYYSNGQGGSVINLGSNPFLQYGTKETKFLQADTISNVVKDIRYTPFNSGVLSNIAYDLGDILTCSGGIAGSGTLNCCVMSIDWTSKNLTNIQGFGADPSLATGKSKTDKVISGLMSKTKENEIIFYTFENSREFEIEEKEAEEVVRLRFSTITSKPVNLWHEINLNVTSTRSDGLVSCQAFYYLDDELIPYSPITTWNNDGFHLLHLLYFVTGTEAGVSHEWKVVLKLTGGSASIDRGGIHASLYGQGLAASDDWTGILDFEDAYSLIYGSSGFVYNFADEVHISESENERLSVEDNYSLVYGSTGYEMNYEDEMSIYTRMVQFSWIDDNDDTMIDSDGDSIVFVG